MNVIYSSLWTIGSYFLMFILTIVLLNLMSKGFIGQFFKVKISNGKYILVKINDVVDAYFKAGRIDSERNLVFKDRLKKNHTFTGIDNDLVRREMSVNVIEVNIVTGEIIKKNNNGIKSADTTIYDGMLKRMIALRTLEDDEAWKKIEKLLIIGIAIGVIFIVYTLLTQEPATCNNVIQAVSNVTNI